MTAPSRSSVLRFEAGDEIEIRNGDVLNKYRIVSKNSHTHTGARRKSRHAEPLGSGGTGVVYLADQLLHGKTRVHRAVKFFLYSDDVIAKRRGGRKSATITAGHFESELQNLSAFQHENIVKVQGAGFWHDSSHDLLVPAVVTEFIEGPTLKEVVERRELETWLRTSPGVVVELAAQLCRGVAHLHSKNFFHCDIAPKNIFVVGRPPETRIVIGDLGAGRTTPLRSRSRLWLVGSRKYAPARVAGQFDTWVAAEVFERMQPEWDLFGLALTIEEMLLSLNRSSSEQRTWQEGLEMIVAEATRTGVFQLQRYSSAQSLATSIEWLHPRERTLAQLPELAENYPDRRLIPVPLEEVAVSERIRRLVDHPQVQRLRKVNQLTLAAAVFPGSTHSRFEHCLGSYEVVRQYLVALLHQTEFQGVIRRPELELALVSGLLSSITRFPFSSIVHEAKSRTPGPQIFKQISRGEILARILRAHAPKKQSLQGLIEANFPDLIIRELESVLGSDRQHLASHGPRFAHHLLNSSLDARVLDYLRRDALHLGIVSGEAFSIGDLLRHARFRNDRVVFSSRGLPLVEQIIAFRYWMFRRIYWNSPTRSATAMIQHVLVQLVQTHRGFESEFLEHALRSSDAEVLHFLSAYVAKHRGENGLRDICDMLIEGRQRWFIEIGELNRAEDEARSGVICDKVRDLSLEEFQALHVRINERAEAHFKKSLRRRSVHLLIDMPVEPIPSKYGEDVNILTYAGELVPLGRVSGLVAGIQQGLSQHLERLRVFANPSSLERLKLKASDSNPALELYDIARAELELL